MHTNKTSAVFPGTFCFFCCCCLIFLSRTAAAQINFDNIKLPDLYPGQGIKTIISLVPNNLSGGNPMAICDSNGVLVFHKYDSTESDQLWFIVQDMRRGAVSFTNLKSGRWLQKIPGTVRMGVTTSPGVETYLGVEGISSNSLFEFILPRQDTAAHITAQPSTSVWKTYTLRQVTAVNDSLVFVHNLAGTASVEATDKSVICGLTPTNFSAVTFCLPAHGDFNAAYIPVPFQRSAYHNTLPVTTSNTTRVRRNNSGTAAENNNITLSNQAIVNNLPEDSSFLQITFSDSTNAEVGWVSYEKTEYSLASFQANGGSCRPRVGIGKYKTSIYLINDGMVDTLTAFNTTTPIEMGCWAGQLILKQGNTIFSSKAVALRSIFSDASVGSKAELIANIQPNGHVDFGYKPGNIVFLKDKAGTVTPTLSTTNPDFAVNPANQSKANKFDWRNSTYKLHYKSNGNEVTEIVASPFFSNEDQFLSIGHKHKADGSFVGGADNTPYEGWELIKHDFGYNNNGTAAPGNELRNEPYMMLYNRYTGVLRVFTYITNPSIANGYRISLYYLNTPKYDANAAYKPPFMWSNVKEHYAMDDTAVAISAYAKTGNLSSTSSGTFYFADFVMNYDPCMRYFESSIGVKLDKVVSGTMTMVGRTQGGVIPQNSPAISDWLNKSNNYLAGVLNTPYGQLSNTLGDITFQDYNKWGSTDFKNEMSFVLPGHKVEDWERKVAQLNYDGLSLQTTGQFTQAAGSVIIAAGEFAGVAASGVVDAGAPIRAAGTVVTAAGQFIEASGTAVQAESARLQLENLQDEPDENIQVRTPDPRPSIMFSELSAKGDVQINTSVFDNIKITTPGSLNAIYAPAKYQHGSKGAFPVYNNPMGLFNLLYKPEFAIAVIKTSTGNYKATIRLKKHPYVAVNNILGVQYPTISVSVGITTYDKATGSSTDSRASAGYIIPYDASMQIDAALRLPAEIDITNLIDWRTVALNSRDSSDAFIERELPRWLDASLMVSYRAYDAKQRNGTYGGTLSEAYFLGSKTCRYTSNINPDIAISALKTLNQNNFSDYDLSDVAVWGNRHILAEGGMANFESKMQSFCQAANSSKIVPNNNAAKRPGDGADSSTVLNTDKGSSNAAAGIRVYPNPTDGEVTVDYRVLTTGNVHLQLCDITGRKLIELADKCDELNAWKQAKYQTNGLAPGTYFIKILFNNGGKYVEKLIRK